MFLFQSLFLEHINQWSSASSEQQVRTVRCHGETTSSHMAMKVQTDKNVHGVTLEIIEFITNVILDII